MNLTTIYKKLVFYVLLNLLLVNSAYSEVLNMFCLIGKSDLKKAKLDETEFNRFAGKVIKLKIDLDENLVYDLSESSQMSIITGINQGVLNFRKTGDGINYINEQDIKGDQGKIIKYNYNNSVSIGVNGRTGRLTSRINQAGISLNRFNFSILCRWYDYNAKEKKMAKNIGAFTFGGSIETKKKKKKRKSTIKKDTTNYDIVNLQSYVAKDLDSLLYLHKAKLFKNSSNNFIFLKNRNYLKFERGQMLVFDDVKDLNERHFFGLPLHNSADKDRLKKLKKEYFKSKKRIKKVS